MTDAPSSLLFAFALHFFPFSSRKSLSASSGRLNPGVTNFSSFKETEINNRGDPLR
jgi:hypothetical protein